MSSKYPDRSVELNMPDRVVFRVSNYHRKKLMEFSQEYKMSISQILREAVTVWLNLNTPKGGK